MVTLTWDALGTTAVLVTADARADAARAAVGAELAAIDRAASRFRPDSEIMRLATLRGRRTVISPLLHEAIALALASARETDGAVDPTLGAELAALGYDRDLAALEPVAAEAPLPAAASPAAPSRRRPRWAEIELTSLPPMVMLPADVGLDLGATAKALAADRAARAAHEATGAGALVALGGDIATCGEPPDGGWPVRVCEDHRGTTEPGQLVQIAGGGLATSSVTTRRWSQAGRARHHILDPATGSPIAVWWRTVSVLAATCAGANTASTAALVLGDGAERWLADRGLAARLVSRAGDVRVLGGWPA